MTAVFLAFFIGGLLLTVLFMLFGVERGSASVSVEYPDPSRRPEIRTLASTFAGFAALYGKVGYLLDTRTTLGMGAVIGIAVLAGIFGGWVVRSTVGKALAFVPEHDPDDPRYVIQGHVAEVTRAIDGDVEGEIVFSIGKGEVRRVPARGIEGSRAEVGSEVVIEKIEDGVAYVEPWAIVQERL